MREELKGPKVENVAVAIAERLDENKNKIHYVYLINLRDDIMEGIIVTSKGYGVNVGTGEKSSNFNVTSFPRSFIAK